MPLTPPDVPSRTRTLLLAPAAALYAAGAALHRALARTFRARAAEDRTAPPLIVIGGLRAGGSGKTPVALALARALAARGVRTGILAYGVARPPRSAADGRVTPGYAEVFPDSDWRESSDEAVLLARRALPHGVRVFVTRDRDATRVALGRARAFDALIADDGLMDARLHGARVLRVALIRPGERPRWHDLLPAGPWRLTASALRQADVVLREGIDYARTPLPPATGPSPLPPLWLLTGLGNPAHFRRAIESLGITVAGVSQGPDHGLPNLARAVSDAARAGCTDFACSAKDWIKLERHPRTPPRMHLIEETVTLGTDFLARVATFLAPPTS